MKLILRMHAFYHRLEQYDWPWPYSSAEDMPKYGEITTAQARERPLEDMTNEAKAIGPEALRLLADYRDYMIGIRGDEGKPRLGGYIGSK